MAGLRGAGAGGLDEGGAAVRMASALGAWSFYIVLALSPRADHYPYVRLDTGIWGMCAFSPKGAV